MGNVSNYVFIIYTHPKLTLSPLIAWKVQLHSKAHWVAVSIFGVATSKFAQTCFVVWLFLLNLTNKTTTNHAKIIQKVHVSQELRRDFWSHQTVQWPIEANYNAHDAFGRTPVDEAAGSWWKSLGENRGWLDLCCRWFSKYLPKHLVGFERHLMVRSTMVLEEGEL